MSCFWQLSNWWIIHCQSTDTRLPAMLSKCDTDGGWQTWWQLITTWEGGRRKSSHEVAENYSATGIQLQLSWHVCHTSANITWMFLIKNIATIITCLIAFQREMNAIWWPMNGLRPDLFIFIVRGLTVTTRHSTLHLWFVHWSDTHQSFSSVWMSYRHCHCCLAFSWTQNIRIFLCNLSNFPLNTC